MVPRPVASPSAASSLPALPTRPAAPGLAALPALPAPPAPAQAPAPSAAPAPGGLRAPSAATLATGVPLWFEALPPRADAAPAAREAALDALAPLAPHVARLLVPDVTDGHYRTEDPLRFAADAQARLGVPAVVALSASDGRLPSRLREAWAAGLRHFLFVGPRDATAGQPGQDVERALRRHAAEVRAAGGSVGVVTLPARRRVRLDEPHRLLDKQRAGADFAVSQILFEAKDALRMRADHLASLAPHEAPVPVVWSLAPVVQARDLRFLEGLGVHIPADLRQRLDHAPDRAQRLEASLVAAEAVAAALLAKPDVPASLGPAGLGSAGLCVSHVMAGNVGAAVRLVQRLAERFGPSRAAAPSATPSVASADPLASVAAGLAA